jgi:hypothetical protein
MSSYASEYPAGNDFDSDYKTFFEKFYETSDTPGAHEKYSKQFTQDATLIMASRKVQGRQGVYTLQSFFDSPVSDIFRNLDYASRNVGEDSQKEAYSNKGVSLWTQLR